MTGFILRPVVKNDPTSEGLFIAMELFLITSPATFLAFNYIIYGRFVRNRALVPRRPYVVRLQAAVPASRWSVVWRQKRSAVWGLTCAAA